MGKFPIENSLRGKKVKISKTCPVHSTIEKGSLSLLKGCVTSTALLLSRNLTWYEAELWLIFCTVHSNFIFQQWNSSARTTAVDRKCNYCSESSLIFQFLLGSQGFENWSLDCCVRILWNCTGFVVPKLESYMQNWTFVENSRFFNRILDFNRL